MVNQAVASTRSGACARTGDAYNVSARVHLGGDRRDGLEYELLEILRGDPDRAVVAVKSTELRDNATVAQFTSELLRVVAEFAPSHLVVDFNYVSRISTAVINALLEAKKRLIAEGADLALQQVSDPMRHTLRILNMDGTIFEVLESPPENR